MRLLSAFAFVLLAATGTRAEGLHGDILYGDPKAKVEVIEYVSFTCPHCAALMNDVMPSVKAEFVDTGKARVLMRNFVRDQIDLMAAAVSRCSDTDAAQKLTGAFFATQHDWIHEKEVPAMLDRLAGVAAKTTGMDRATFDACAADTDMQQHLVGMMQKGAQLYMINAVPTIFVNGIRVMDTSAEGVKAAIETALKY